MSADTRVAASGPGSPGNETSYYGPLTASAVTSFQEKFSADVLAPLGLMSGTGYWGSSTGSKAQELCTTTPSDDSDDDMSGDLDDLLGDSGDDSDDSDEDESDDEPELSGGEASLEDFDYNTGDDNDVEEGNTAEVAELDFDVEDGDVRVARADIGFRLSDEPNNNSEADDEPWDVFEEVTLMADGEEVASMQVDSEDDWLDDDPSDIGGNDYYEVRFTGLDTVVEQGDEAVMQLEVETQSNVDEAGNVEWTTVVDDRGVRARDGEGIDQYVPDGTESDDVSFDVDKEGGDEGLDISRSSEDPDQTIVPVDRDDDSDPMGVFAFDLEADDNDIDVDQVNLNTTFRDLAKDSTFTTSSDSWFGKVVNEATLELDGERFDSDDENVSEIADGSGSEATSTAVADLEFDVDEDFTIEEDETATAFLLLEFNQQQGNYNDGLTVQGAVDDTAPSDYTGLMSSDDLTDGSRYSGITGEGVDDVEGDGNAYGDEHTVLSTGIYSDTPADTTAETRGGDDSDRGFFSFDVDLTAFDEEEVYIEQSATSSFNEVLNGPNSSATTSRTLRDQNYDTETVDGTDYYVIGKGDTEEFTVEYTVSDLNSGDAGDYYMELDTVDFSTETDAENDGGGNDGIDNVRTYNFTPQADYDTDTIFIDEDQ